MLIKRNGPVYTNRSGNQVPAVLSRASCKCKRKCCDKLGNAAIQGLFSGFYELKSKDNEDAYLFSLISLSHSKAPFTY